MVKVIYCETDDFDDLSIRTAGISMKAKCHECDWSEWLITGLEQEADLFLTRALRHSHVTGHRVDADRSQDWEVERYGEAKL